MATHDTSGHSKHEMGDMTTGMRQGNDTEANPGHGASENTHRSLKHGEGKYEMELLDKHRTEDIGGDAPF